MSLSTDEIDELKRRWLEKGWMRVSARNNEQGDRLLLSGFLYPPESGARQQLKLSGGHDPETQYDLFNGDHAYLGANAFETSIELCDLRTESILSMSTTSTSVADTIPWHQSWHLLSPEGLPFPPGPNQQRIGQKAIDDQWFYFSGGTFVHKLGAVLDQLPNSRRSPDFTTIPIAGLRTITIKGNTSSNIAGESTENYAELFYTETL